MGAFSGTQVHIDLTRNVVAAVVVVAVALVCTLRQASASGLSGRRASAGVADVLLCAAAAAATGGWLSPYLLTVGGAVLANGLLFGARRVVPGIGVLASFALATEVAGAGIAVRYLAPERATEIAVMGLLGACIRRGLLRTAGDPDELDRLRHAAAVRALLLDLYARTAQQPGSLSVQATVAGVVERIQQVFDPKAVALALRQPEVGPTARTWRVAECAGCALPHALADGDLPPGLSEALRSGTVVSIGHLGPDGGISIGSRSGMYTTLRSEGEVIGLLGVESGRSEAFSPDDAAFLSEVATHAALAIENGRLFARLRLVGADEERDRFARDLHDRLGQTLASIALAADRTAGRLAEGAAFDAAVDVEDIAADVRGALREVREKLTDVRSGPADGLPLHQALEQFAGRVAGRSGLLVTCDLEPLGLPVHVEREVWRIGSEAIINAERHAHAASLYVGWRRIGGVPTLVVADDGSGLGGIPLRHDAYGLRGMRERAEVVRGALTISSSPEDGTRVTLTLPRTVAEEALIDVRPAVDMGTVDAPVGRAR